MPIGSFRCPSRATLRCGHYTLPLGILIRVIHHGPNCYESQLICTVSWIESDSFGLRFHVQPFCIPRRSRGPNHIGSKPYNSILTRINSFGFEEDFNELVFRKRRRIPSYAFIRCWFMQHYHLRTMHAGAQLTLAL